MSRNIFTQVELPIAVTTVHNVRLLNVQPAESGYELLTVEHNGATLELASAARWSEEHSRRNVGRIGFLVTTPNDGLSGGQCYFRPYVDQSLRREYLDREPSLAEGGPAVPMVAWSCDARPNGFFAPVGLVPGERGQYVPDESIAITLRVPPEFVREAKRVQMSPEALLRSFIADLAGIENTMACPRADGYSSNGSDERDYAQAWLDRAHAPLAIDIESLESEEQAQDERLDALTEGLETFQQCGGDPDELVAAFVALVNQQVEKDMRAAGPKPEQDD